MFAELASHFPVAGSIYQWSKRLSNRGLGWFTGWFYFWAQVVTVTAVAVIVAYVIDGFIVADRGLPRVQGPTGLTTMFTFIAIVTLIITTLINAYGVRLLSLLNNIGVGTEILGMLVFALILLFFANDNPPSILTDTAGTEQATGGQYLPAFALGMFMAMFVIYGFDTAGTFGEETLDATRQAPRGVLWSVARLGHRRHRLPARGDPGHPGRARRDRGARPSRSPTHHRDLDLRDRRRHHRSASSTCSSS